MAPHRRPALAVVAATMLVAVLGGIAGCTTLKADPSGNQPEAIDGLSAIGATPIGSVDRSRWDGPVPEGRTDAAPVVTVGGTATLSGVVSDGARARVRLTRWVGSRSASVVLTADDQGRFTYPSAPGGRWSVTAWRVPDRPAGPTETSFVDDGGSASFSLRMGPVGAPNLTVGLLAGGTGTWEAVVRYFVPVVGDDGRSRQVGEAFSAEITAPRGWDVPAVVTGADGGVSFVVQCRPPAAAGELVVNIDGQTAQVVLPDCAPSTTTTTTPSTATTRPSPSTTTTSSSTTSTTAPTPEDP